MYVNNSSSVLNSYAYSVHKKRDDEDGENNTDTDTMEFSSPSVDDDDDDSLVDRVGESEEENPYSCCDHLSDKEYDAEKKKKLRTLTLEYWNRSDECKERKWQHLDDLDEQIQQGRVRSREHHILSTTLRGKSVVLEPNLFPYDTPSDIQHWTLWSTRQNMKHCDVQNFVYAWIQKYEEQHQLSIVQWNYDDNPERSIDLFHVHVYFQLNVKLDDCHSDCSSNNVKHPPLYHDKGIRDDDDDDESNDASAMISPARSTIIERSSCDDDQRTTRVPGESAESLD